MSRGLRGEQGSRGTREQRQAGRGREQGVPGTAWSTGSREERQVGRGWLLEPEQRAMFGLWAALKSPLFIAADLWYIPPPSRQILQNAEVVALLRDPLGVAADRIWKRGPLEVSACIFFSPPNPCQPLIYSEFLSF